MTKGEKRTYVVQRAVVPVIEQAPAEAQEESVDYVVTLKPCQAAAEATLWEDYSRILVEPRVQRKTIIDRATLTIEDRDLPQFFRALDLESGAVIPLHIDQPAPRPRPKARRKVG